MSGEPWLDPGSCPRRAAGIEALHLDGQDLLFDGRKIRLLAGPAAQIWARVDGLSTVATIADDLAAAFEVPQSDVVRADVRRFLGQLVEQGVLEMSTSPTRPYVRPPHVGYVEDGDLTLLVDLADGRRRGLTSTGGRIWQLVCSGASAVRVVDVLRLEFPDAPDSLDSEVVALLEELVDSGFLTTGLREAEVIHGNP